MKTEMQKAYEKLLETRTSVKAVMELLGFEVEDRGIPKFSICTDDAIEGLLAGYVLKDHTIYIANKLIQMGDAMLFELVAHELCHSFQSEELLNTVTVMPTDPLYWSSVHERQAYTVGCYFIMHSEFANSEDPDVIHTKSKMAEYIANDDVSTLVDILVSKYQQVYLAQLV